MNVALVNKNPAVSRLITLSLDKIGARYSEFDEISQLENKVDFLIIDSDTDTTDVNLKDFAVKIMYLIPRGSDAPSVADVVLEKPFLPTDFITIFEKNKHISEDMPKAKEESVAGTKFSSELEEISFELPDFSDINLEDKATADKVQDDSNALVDETKDDDNIDENLEDMFKDLPNIDEFHADINASSGTTEFAFSELDEALADIGSSSDKPNYKIEMPDETNIEELNLESEPKVDSGFGELANVIDEIDTMADTKDENTLSDVNFNEVNLDDEQADSIENIKHILDDIDTAMTDMSETNDVDLVDTCANSKENLEESNTALDEFLADEPDNKESADGGFDLDGLENLIKDKNLEDIQDEHIILDENLSKEEPISESENLDSKMILDEVVNDEMIAQEANLVDEPLTDKVATDATLDEIAVDSDLMDDLVICEENVANEPIEHKELTQIQDVEQISEISDIDEASMMAAFGLESAAAAIKEIKKSDIKPENFKDELSKKITEHIKTSLGESSIKEALKDMNIKINISFEER